MILRVVERINNGFDLIGDVHGHSEQLIGILEQLGYQKGKNAFPTRIKEWQFLWAT